MTTPNAQDTCVATPTKQTSFRQHFSQIYDWKHLYLCIFLVQPSVILPQLQLRFWSYCAPPGDGLLGALNYIVAKRQCWFSCGLSAATLSLKFENVVPTGWIRFFPFYIWVIFLLLYEHVRARVVTFSLFFFGFVQPRNKHACGTVWWYQINT